MSYDAPQYLPRITSRIDDRRATGACRGLSGNVFLTLFFVDDPESRWTQSEIDRYIEKSVFPSVRYLEKHASRWQIPLKLTVGYYCTGQAKDFSLRWPKVLPSRFHEDTRGMVSWCVEQTNHDSIREMNEYLCSGYESRQVVYALVLNKPGRCCAVSASRWNHPSEREYMLLYARNGQDRRPEYSCAVAHELLHQFGAIDLYYPNDPTEERLNYTKMLFPDDIMYRVDPDLNALHIGAVTAHMIGWLEHLPERYGCAAWWERKL